MSRSRDGVTQNDAAAHSWAPEAQVRASLVARAGPRAAGPLTRAWCSKSRGRFKFDYLMCRGICLVIPSSLKLSSPQSSSSVHVFSPASGAGNPRRGITSFHSLSCLCGFDPDSWAMTRNREPTLPSHVAVVDGSGPQPPESLRLVTVDPAGREPKPGEPLLGRSLAAWRAPGKAPQRRRQNSTMTHLRVCRVRRGVRGRPAAAAAVVPHHRWGEGRALPGSRSV